MMEEIWHQILAGASNSTPLELVGVTFGILSVWFAKRENILVFPTGIVNVTIFIYICAIYKLYADMSVNAYYLIMSIYGWVVWSRKVAGHSLKISRTSRAELPKYLLGTIVVFFILYFLLSRYTDSDVPVLDSMTTSMFILAMILMAKKKVEHWIAWILGNSISIPLYLYKGLAFTSLQYVIFTFIAISGLISWTHFLKKS